MHRFMNIDNLKAFEGYIYFVKMLMILLTEYICLSLTYQFMLLQLRTYRVNTCRVLELEIMFSAYKSNVFPNSSRKEKCIKMTESSANSLTIYEAQTLLLNGMSVSDTRVGHRHSYDTCRTRICEMFNLKSIC